MGKKKISFLVVVRSKARGSVYVCESIHTHLRL